MAERVARDAGVASPCTNVCTLDPQTGWCVGCYRTIAEIAAWGTIDDHGKRAILQALPARRRQAKEQGRADR